MNRLQQRMGEGFLLLDGAMGTQLQQLAFPGAAGGEHDGCNEWLNLAAPDAVRSVHDAYLAAGCDALETNTFGAAPVTLAEYGLAERAREINLAGARLARAAADAAGPGRFVFGSVGPGHRLPSLGQITFDELVRSYRVQVEALLEGGVDAVLFETCQDLLQIKAGLAALREAAGRGPALPVFVSVTIEPSGTLLAGADLGAVAAVVAPYRPDVIGLNCATGPEAMRGHLEKLSAWRLARIACMPNAGMPASGPQGVYYPLGPEAYAKKTGTLVRTLGLDLAGGCCGTTPEHLRALRAFLKDYRPPDRPVNSPPEQAASLYTAVDLSQEPRPLFIGERANASGSRRFRDRLLADDFEGALQILAEQEDGGAHLLDLNCAYSGRDEKNDLCEMVQRAAQACRLPLVLDTTHVQALEAALERYGGRAVINSIHFEDGGARAEQVAHLARRHGAALVGLTIDEQGMAQTVERKLAVARRLVAFCEERGFRRGDLLIDPLTFTIASGDPSLRGAARETLAALRLIKQRLPGVRTLLGISNVSYGLRPAARRVLNAVFLHKALEAGLDACLVHVGQLVSLQELAKEHLQLAEALVDNPGDESEPLERFIRCFDNHLLEEQDAPAGETEPEEALRSAVLRGRLPVGEIISRLVAERRPESILNDVLIPAMEEVGRLFNTGALPLPFVLKSAEVMKSSVDALQPYWTGEERDRTRGSIVLATVAGDVHDIGKNLVHIILSNNGFRVIDLGVKASAERIIGAVREEKPEVLGLSGLLVRSTEVMVDNLKSLREAGLDLAVLLGGAALTPAFVERSCAPVYPGPVRYCIDAFAGLSEMRALCDGNQNRSPRKPVRTGSAQEPPAPPDEGPEPLDHSPLPPAKRELFRLESIGFEELLPYLNEKVLIASRWKFRRGKRTKEAYEEMLKREARPRLAALKERCLREDLFQPRVAGGFFDGRAEGNDLLIERKGGGQPVRLSFPRQSGAPHRCLADFFRPEGDLVALFCATLGDSLEKADRRLFEENAYQEYFLMHEFGAALTEALAEYAHAHVRRRMGLEKRLSPASCIRGRYRGARFGFGYSCCPDTAMNRTVCELIEADYIGIALTTNNMLVPEMSVCALVAHHPKARHFHIPATGG